jgi:ABC-type transport system involved in multi-copper enzyme maturation permease subunit
MSQLRAELLKLRTTRTTLGLVLGMVALVLLFVLLTGLLSAEGQLDGRSDQYGLLGTGAVALFFGSLVGVMLVTTEYRYGTVRPTLLYAPKRERVLVAKLVAAAIAGAIFGAIGEGLALGVGSLILSLRGIPQTLVGGGLVRLALGTVVVTALWAAIGAGVGAIVRHQVGAIIGVIAWLLVIENLIFGLVPSVGRYAPGPAGQAFAGDTAAHLLSPLWGGLLFLAWAAAIGLAGTFVALRRDVD